MHVVWRWLKRLIVGEGSCEVVIYMSSLSGGVLRPALADVTKYTRKRTFDGYCVKNSDDGMEDVAEKKVCLRLENVGMEKNFEETDRVGKHSVVDLDVASEVGLGGAATVDDLDVEGANVGRRVIELDDVSRDSCGSVPLIPLGSDSCNGDSSIGEISQVNTVRDTKPLESSLHGDCENDATVDFDQSESSESAKSEMPNKVQSFVLERCTSLKRDSNSNSASAADLLKTCSCPFCLKAAYIWSDLHYQDVKGRISALKKRKKEAVNLFQRICSDKEANEGNSDKTSKLESELSSQWRSLFLHMEESFGRESNHLHDNFLALKDLRENCKVNLEMIDAKPADHD